MIIFSVSMVARLFSRGTKVFDSEQNTILSAASVIGFVYCISALLGFVKIRLLSTYFGDSAELGLYFAADDIPTLIFTFIVSGSLSAAFIPVFTKHYKRSRKDAWNISSSVINISVLLFLFCLAVVLVGGEFLVKNTVAINSSLTQDEIKLTANLMRIMMLAQIGFIFSNLYTGILQSFNRFIVPALAPVMLNIGVITFLVLFYKPLGIYAPAYGTAFGALLHMGIQLPSTFKLGFKYKLILDFKNKAVQEVYKLMIPRTLGQAANKLLIPLYTNLALFISAPSNVILTFAFDIQSLPVRVLGISMGQAALPILANAYDDHDISHFKKLLIKTTHQVIFLTLPVAILLFVLRVPLVRLTVGSSKYSWEATVMTAYTLAFYSFSLIAQVLVVIFARAFYAMYDTKTPVKISLTTMVLNAFLAIFFVRYLLLGVWSLGLAYAVSSVLTSLFLFFFLMSRIGGIDFESFMKPINRMGISALIMGVALYVPLKIMDELIFDTTRTIGLLILTGTVTVIGGITYLGLTKLFKLKELEIVSKAYFLVLRNFRKYIKI